MSCILSLCEKVVFPDEEGPAIITSFTFPLFIISSAISPIFFSIYASEIRIISLVIPFAIISLSEPTSDTPISIALILALLSSLKIFSSGTNSSTTSGFSFLGITRTIPSLYFVIANLSINPVE